MSHRVNTFTHINTSLVRTMRYLIHDSMQQKDPPATTVTEIDAHYGGQDRQARTGLIITSSTDGCNNDTGCTGRYARTL